MNWSVRTQSSRRRGSYRTLLACSEALERRLFLSANVLQGHYDNQNTGQALNETTLTSSNVNAANFGKLFSTKVDGAIFAQPLYVANVNITSGSFQGIHNVVYLATEGDSLYAIDANAGTVLWHDSFINPSAGITPATVKDLNVLGIQPNQGITGTPVIDPGTNTLYLDAEIREVEGATVHILHMLHAINIQSGVEADGGPATIADSVANSNESAFTPVSGPTVAGTGAGSVGGVLMFNALYELQRPGLVISNGTVYIAYGSNSDTGPYHGWVLGFNESTLKLDAVFCDTPNGGLGGIWQGGGDITVDPDTGDLFIAVGNGAFDTTLNAQGFPSLGDYGDSVVKLVPDSSTSANPNINGWGMHVGDYFSPYNEAELNGNDFDVGSSGPLILPDSVGSAAHPHLLIAGGKEGRLYLIDRDNMGKFNLQNDNVVQEVINADLGTATEEAYFDGQVYVVSAYGGTAYTYAISNGQLSTTFTSESNDIYGWPGSSPVISSDSATDLSNAVVWTTDTGTKELRAYGAGNFGNEVYNSSQAPVQRDAPDGTPTKFEAVTVAAGKVYVTTNLSKLDVYGLLPPPTTAPKLPTGLAVGTGLRGQLVLAWSNTATNQSGIVVQESTDGGSTFNTIATLMGYPDQYTVSGLSDSTACSFRIEAFNNIGNSGWTPAQSGTTAPGPQGSTIDFSGGFAAGSSALTFNGSAKLNPPTVELTDGGANEAGSVLLDTPADVKQFYTVFNFQMNSASAQGLTFLIAQQGPSALGTSGSGLGYSGINNSVAVEFSLVNPSNAPGDATGLLINGALPSTLNTTSLSATGLNFAGGDPFHVILQYDGATLTETITDTLTNNTVTDTYTVDIASIVGGSNAYVGFSGSTATQTAVQNITSWMYVPGDPPPKNLTAAPLTPTSVTLKWTELGTNQVGFKIEESSDGVSFSQVAETAGNITSFVLNNLQPSTSYTFAIRAAHPPGDSGYSNLATAQTAAGTGLGTVNDPTGFSGAAANFTFNGGAALSGANLDVLQGQSGTAGSIFTDTAVDIDQFQTAFDFQIPLSKGNGFTFTLQGKGPSAIGGAYSGLGYYTMADSICIKFDLYNSAGEGPDSTGLFVNGALPETPAIDMTSSDVNLHSGDTFHVVLSYDGSVLTQTVTDTITHAVFTHQYTINLLSLFGTNVAYAGFTASSGGLSCTPTILDWTFAPTPAAPVSLTATAVSATEIDLAWIDSASSQTGFTIERSTDDISFSPIAMIANVNEYPDESFNGGTNYYYEVVATNAFETSAPSNVATAIAPNPPATPSDPQATKITTTEIDLKWVNNANNATNYDIYRKDGEDGTLNLVATLPASATTYNDTELMPGTLHDYHIEAVNISGHNDFAGIALYTLCTAPTGVKAVGGVGEITVSWDPTMGASSYILYRGYAVGLESNQPLFTGITTNDYVDVGIPPSTTYWYKVVAVDSSGFSDQSLQASDTTSSTAALNIVAETPTPGGVLFPGVAITATFDNDIGESDTLSGSTFTLTPVGGNTPVLADISYDSTSNTATLTPVASLTPGQQYTATLSSLIADDEDNFLYGGFTWMFTVAQNAPTIVGFSPSTGAAGVSTTSKFTAQFSEAMDAGTINSSTVFLTSNGNIVPASVTYNSSTDAVALQPTTYLATGATYIVTFEGGPGGVKEGETDVPMAANFVSTFTTTTTPADAATYVSESVPTNMAAGQQYSVTMTMLDTGTNTWNYIGGSSGIRLGSQDLQDNHTWGMNRVVESSPVSPGNNGVFTFNVTAPSTPGTYNFQWRMVDERIQWFGDFTPVVQVKVSPAPTVTATTPVSGSSGATTTTAITAAFSEAMDPATINSSTVVLSCPGVAVVPATVTYSSTTHLVTLQPSYFLGTATAYTLTILGGASGVKEAMADVPMAANFVSTFTATTTPADAATYVSESVPTNMIAGQQYSVTITLLNTGTNTWNYISGASGIRLGSQDAQDNHTWGMNRVPESSPVSMGNDGVFTFTVTAPSTTGIYNFQWRMVDERINWFGDFTPIVPIQVSTVQSSVKVSASPLAWPAALWVDTVVPVPMIQTAQELAIATDSIFWGVNAKRPAIAPSPGP